MTGPGASAIVAPEPEVAKGLRRWTEHGVAVGYGLAYDAIVRSFPPYQALLDEVVTYARRSVAPAADPRSVHVLDVASGIGTLAFRLAREGYTVVGVDSVEYLVEVARERRRARGVPNVAFHQLDIGGAEVPWHAHFDFAVSLHTYYWHPRPDQMLAATRRALKPGAHALLLNYSRPAHVGSAFRDIRARQGMGPALQALRWLIPTAMFDGLRDYEPHYTDAPEFHEALTQAGFEILEARRTFLADISVLAWVRRSGEPIR